MKFGLNKKVPTQGGSGKAPVQGAKIQSAPSGVKKPAKSEIKYGYAPAGQKGTGTNKAGSIGKLKK
jgi:hypothetical protein